MNAKVIAFAIEAHNNTNHLYDGKPYSVHLAMVVGFAYKHIDALPDQVHETVIDACWLHDTIEDCRLTYNDIMQVAGVQVADIVYAVSNDKGKNRKERAGEAYYAGIRKTSWASFVKLCDRLANVRYSKDAHSKMLEVYRKENEAFVSSILPQPTSVLYYGKMIKELNELLA